MRERIKNHVKDIDQVTIVGEAANGSIAMEMILEFLPDLIFLDLSMPVLNGMEVLRRIKDAKIKTKVCILTNYSFPQYKSKCLKMGADYFLSKSDDFERTSMLIYSMLEEK
jgi:DNA-binding NarL/FixJ family response regulator